MKEQCQFHQKLVEYLGHAVEAEGLHTIFLTVNNCCHFWNISLQLQREDEHTSYATVLTQQEQRKKDIFDMIVNNNRAHFSDMLQDEPQSWINIPLIALVRLQC